MVLALLSMVVTGPLGLLAFGAGVAAFAMDVVDVARGREDWKALLLSALNILVPDVRGLIGLKDLGAGMRALFTGVKGVGGKAVDVLSSSAAFRAFMAHGGAGKVVWHAAPGLPGLVWRGFQGLPGVWGRGRGGWGRRGCGRGVCSGGTLTGWWRGIRGWSRRWRRIPRMRW